MRGSGGSRAPMRQDARPAVAPEVSFCIVNTAQRELLVACLDAVAAERARLPFPAEVLVLDNCSGDGSAGAARRHPAADEVIALPERRGKAENDTALLRRARGRYCLLLNEDSELLPGATAALRAAIAGAGGSEVVLTGPALEAWIDGEASLRDDFAPVDQLLTPYSG